MNSKAFIRPAIYLLVYLGLPVMAFWMGNETVTSVLLIICIFLLIPFGILKMSDFYRDNDGSTWFSRIFNVVFRMPLALFGLVTLLTGVSIILWGLYNVLIERQKEYSRPSFVFGWASFGVGPSLVLFGWFTLRSVLWRIETPSPEEQEEFEHEEEDDEIAAADEKRALDGSEHEQE